MTSLPSPFSPPTGFSLVVDLSKFQAGIDYAAIVEAGAIGAFVKATEGAGYVDPLFEAHAVGAAAVGLQVGAYHVFHPEEDVDAQAKNFRARGFDRCALCPVVDLELAAKQLALSDVAVRAAEFVDAVADDWNKTRGLVYASPSFVSRLGATTEGLAALERAAARWELWVAHYGVPWPTVPKPWGAFRGWQFSGGSDRIGGVPVDLSWFAAAGPSQLALLGATK